MSNHSAAPDRTLTAPMLAAERIAAGNAGAAMPGWHVFADFSPPELAAERRVKKVRVAMIAVVVLVAAAAFLGYDFAQGQAAEARAAVDTETAIAASLRSQQQQFSSVTTLQATINQARAELGTLLASDIDADALVAEIWAALPQGMTINQFTIAVPPQTPGNSAKADGVAALDPSTAQHIGTVTVGGTGTGIDDVPAFIDTLAGIPGVYQPFPTSNQTADEGGTTFSLEFTLTDVLLTHLYDGQEGN